MKKYLRQMFDRTTLATKIRMSYLLLLIPLVSILVFFFYIMWTGNRNYGDMIYSSLSATQFSLDFEKDFNYETYLLVIENKTIEESRLREMLDEANGIVDGLQELTTDTENLKRLNSVKKYLHNLETYVERIEQNLQEGNHYEDNIEIWGNDIQIVTHLIRETVIQYIYSEIRGLRQSRAEYQSFFMSMVRFSLFVFVGIFVLTIALSYWIPQSITRPITKISEVTDQVAKGDLTVRSDVRGGAEAGMLSDSLNTMIDEMNELLEQVKKEQIRLRRAEFELLQAQINPHFLYNTLDAIVWLAESGEQKRVVSMVGSLSEFFRMSLNQGKDIVSIAEELQHVRSYLEIQQVRYQDILSYEIDVPDCLKNYRIPKITIQPLVENALYHGIKNKRGCGKIRIRGWEDKECFFLQVEDDGIGIEEGRLEQIREGILHKAPTEQDIYGLYNVNERIQLDFGEAYGITIESTYGEGTCVKVCLPCERNETQL